MLVGIDNRSLKEFVEDGRNEDHNFTKHLIALFFVLSSASCSHLVRIPLPQNRLKSNVVVL